MIKWTGSGGAKPPSSFENHMLIIPAVSVGNVGQLTIDLVLENAKSYDTPKKIGQIFHSALESVVANNNTTEEQDEKRKDRVRPKDKNTKGPANPPDQSNNNPEGNSTPASNNDVKPSDEDNDCLMTACEIYHCPKRRWVVLQFHSAVRKRDRDEFISFLLNWIKEARFTTVICFSSIFTSERLDANISGASSRIQVLYSDKIENSYLEKVNSLGWKRLLSPSLTTKKETIQPLEHIEENLSTVNLSGSGITKNLLMNCQSVGIPCLTLMIYASDGDNTVDAIFLYKESSHLFEFIPQSRFGDPPSKIRIPYIWHAHLGMSSQIGLGMVEEGQAIISLPSGSSSRRNKKYDDPPNTIF